jgi:hypothetical protein
MQSGPDGEPTARLAEDSPSAAAARTDAWATATDAVELPQLPPREPQRGDDAAPTPLPHFDHERARAALAEAAGAAGSCQDEAKQGSRILALAVTFAPSGSVAVEVLNSGPYARTAEGRCMVRIFEAARVGPFAGEPTTLRTTIHLR